VNSKKKASLGAAALSMTSIALAAGVPSSTSVAGAAGTNGLQPPPVNANDYSLSCGTVAGKIGFSPGLTYKETGPIALAIKIKATDCTASPPLAGGPPLNISKVTMSGALGLPNGASCSGSAYRTLTGALTMKYKTAHGSAKVAAEPGPINIIWGSWSWVCSPAGSVSVWFPSVPQVGVQLPGVQLSGPFAGGDGGASSKIVLFGGTFSSSKLSSPGGVRSVIYQEMPGNSLFLG
jgi:hypothetical protein